jgi:small subunit ribosomal protein S16
MLKIRLQRVGRKNNPSFRLVLTDSKNATKSGKFLEVLGHFDYRKDSKDSHIDADKIKHWMSKGVQLTDNVHNLLLGKGLISGKKINILPRKSPPKVEAPAEEKKAEAPKAEAPAAAPAAEPAPAN